MLHTVLDHFIRQVALSGNRTAINYNGYYLTYKQLDEASNKLCNVLHQKGIVPGDNVPIVSLRTPEFIIGLLAICKLGATYTPIDANYPEKRIQDIAEQSNSSVIVVSNSSIIITFNDKITDIVSIEDLPHDTPTTYDQSESDDQRIAYIIFTSGTTGSPKGVEISHAALNNLIVWYNERFNLDNQCRSSLIAGIGFDVAQWEIWSALTSGSTLYLPHEEIRLQPEDLLRFLDHNEITHVFVPTVLVPEMVSLPQPKNLKLRYMFTAGEKLPPVNFMNLSYDLVDFYGPTEATIFVTYNKVESAHLGGAASIGYPIADTEIFILDEQLHPILNHDPGELFISGTCLAKGYLNNPTMTDEKFVTPEHFAGKRLYRSGDLACWLPDGRIQYLGRTDQQIKIRGNRVELAEIENVIMQVPEVKKAVAVISQNENLAEKKIIVFLLAFSPDTQPTNRVRAHMKKILPSYFMPADFQWLNNLPLNPNGKIDKVSLLKNYQPTANDPHLKLEKKYEPIAAIWRELLGTKQISPTDNFFDIGGHSLLAAQLASLLGKKMGVKVYARDIYEYPTLHAQEQAMEERVGHTPPVLDSEPFSRLQDDVYLPADVRIDPNFDPHQITEPRNILLTGATGFVGSHLLAELLVTTNAHIFCLAREKMQESAEQRLDRVLNRYQITLSAEQRERVHVIKGDIAEHNFGLTTEMYDSLCYKTDIIYHSASSVNFIQPYSYMKRDNVQGLREVIRLATINHTKPVILLSTIAVYSWGHRHTGKKIMLENDDIDQNLPAVVNDMGYVRSKWVMEKIADLAASQGLPLMTFRLGYATYHSQTGTSADYQWWGRLVKTCL
ncbi:non-ribosomal peptide synthetase [Serratia sp. NPDC078593]|uniref:non-ribosomal peptide synthetase n=1 Tax=unclassified Serratia (in: enterobacteria) TaxID=2647522 RepID=UPI0037D73038